MYINGIHCLGHVMPVAGKHYTIARVTAVSGDLPKELSERTYDINGTKVERLTIAPSELGIEGSTCEDLIALYIMVEQVGTEGNQVEFRIVQSMDDFLEPFELTSDVAKEYADYFLNNRSQAAALESITFTLDDDDDDSHTPCIGWVSSLERYYLDKQAQNIEMAGTPAQPRQVVPVQQLSELRGDSSISMLFASMLDKAVDLYNGLNYYNKADDVAKIIGSIMFINESGEKGHLNFTAVEKFFSNVKDRLLVGESISKPVVRRNEE